MSSTHVRFDDASQEWQLVDNETHEILRVADTASGLAEDEEDEDDEDAELRAERDRLLEILQSKGGRDIELAEEIDEISRQLGEAEDDDA